MEVRHDRASFEKLFAKNKSSFCNYEELVEQGGQEFDARYGTQTKTQLKDSKVLKYLSAEPGETVMLKIGPSFTQSPTTKEMETLSVMNYLISQSITPHLEELITAFVCPKYVDFAKLDNAFKYWEFARTSVIFLLDQNTGIHKQPQHRGFQNQYSKEELFGLDDPLFFDGRHTTPLYQAIYDKTKNKLDAQIIITRSPKGRSITQFLEDVPRDFTPYDLGVIIFQVLFTIKEMVDRRIRHNKLDVNSVSIEELEEPYSFVYFITSENYVILETKYMARVCNFAYSDFSVNPAEDWKQININNYWEAYPSINNADKYDLYSFVASLYAHSNAYVSKARKPDERHFHQDFDEVIERAYNLTVLEQRLIPDRFNEGRANVFNGWFLCTKTNNQNSPYKNEAIPAGWMNSVTTVLNEFSKKLQFNLTTNGYPEHLKPLQTPVPVLVYNDVRDILKGDFYVASSAGPAIAIANKLAGIKVFKAEELQGGILSGGASIAGSAVQEETIKQLTVHLEELKTALNQKEADCQARVATALDERQKEWQAFHAAKIQEIRSSIPGASNPQELEQLASYRRIELAAELQAEEDLKIKALEEERTIKEIQRKYNVSAAEAQQKYEAGDYDVTEEGLTEEDIAKVNVDQEAIINATGPVLRQMILEARYSDILLVLIEKYTELKLSRLSSGVLLSEDELRDVEEVINKTFGNLLAVISAPKRLELHNFVRRWVKSLGISGELIDFRPPVPTAAGASAQPFGFQPPAAQSVFMGQPAPQPAPQSVFGGQPIAQSVFGGQSIAQFGGQPIAQFGGQPIAQPGSQPAAQPLDYSAYMSPSSAPLQTPAGFNPSAWGTTMPQSVAGTPSAKIPPKAPTKLTPTAVSYTPKGNIGAATVENLPKQPQGKTPIQIPPGKKQPVQVKGQAKSGFPKAKQQN